MVAEALEDLLERKHLYQSVKLDLDPLVEVIQHNDEYDRSIRPSTLWDKPIYSTEQRAAMYLGSPWEFQSKYALSGNAAHEAMAAAPVGQTSERPPKFDLPTVNLRCDLCDGILPPHNPVHTDSAAPLYSCRPRSGDRQIQIYLLPYECQNCHGEPVLFMVRREGLKLTLVGRSRFEQVVAPKYVPKDVSRFYTGAVIAFNTGHPLAATFYLRTLIEQYMRSVVNPTSRVTGDELADAYGKTLSPDFSSRYPSFRKIYDELSGAIHEAREDEVVFKASIGDVEKHLEAKPYFMATKQETE